MSIYLTIVNSTLKNSLGGKFCVTCFLPGKKQITKKKKKRAAERVLQLVHRGEMNTPSPKICSDVKTGDTPHVLGEYEKVYYSHYDEILGREGRLQNKSKNGMKKQRRRLACGFMVAGKD